MVWVSEVVSMTWSEEGSFDRGILITSFMDKTVDISEYLDFGFYDELWYKDN